MTVLLNDGNQHLHHGSDRCLRIFVSSDKGSIDKE